MELIKVDWEIGKNKFDKYLIYYIWLVFKFLSFYPMVWRKESQIPVPKIFRINLVKLVVISVISIFILFVILFNYFQQDSNNGLFIFLLMVLLGMVGLLTVYICICMVFYVFRFAFRLLEAFVDTILIFREGLKGRIKI